MRSDDPRCVFRQHWLYGTRDRNEYRSLELVMISKTTCRDHLRYLDVSNVSNAILMLAMYVCRQLDTVETGQGKTSSLQSYFHTSNPLDDDG